MQQLTLLGFFPLCCSDSCLCSSSLSYLRAQSSGISSIIITLFTTSPCLTTINVTYMLTTSIIMFQQPSLQVPKLVSTYLFHIFTRMFNICTSILIHPKLDTLNTSLTIPASTSFTWSAPFQRRQLLYSNCLGPQTVIVIFDIFLQHPTLSAFFIRSWKSGLHVKFPNF